MLGALGGLSMVALVLVREEFKPPVFLFWLAAAVVMWLHEHAGALMGAI